MNGIDENCLLAVESTCVQCDRLSQVCYHQHFSCFANNCVGHKFTCVCLSVCAGGAWGGHLTNTTSTTLHELLAPGCASLWATDRNPWTFVWGQTATTTRKFWRILHRNPPSILLPSTFLSSFGFSLLLEIDKCNRRTSHSCQSDRTLALGVGCSQDGLDRSSKCTMGKLNGTLKSRRHEMRDERLSGRTWSNDLSESHPLPS